MIQPLPKLPLQITLRPDFSAKKIDAYISLRIQIFAFHLDLLYIVDTTLKILNFV